MPALFALYFYNMLPRASATVHPSTFSLTQTFVAMDYKEYADWGLHHFCIKHFFHPTTFEKVKSNVYENFK